MCTHLPCPFSVIFLVKTVYNTCKTIASVRYYVCQREGNGPAGVAHSPGPGPQGRSPMDTRESSAPHAHPSTEEQDDTVEAHYSGLERLEAPHACCYEGVVYIGHLVEDPGTGEEVEVFKAVLCLRFDDSRAYSAGP